LATTSVASNSVGNTVRVAEAFAARLCDETVAPLELFAGRLADGNLTGKHPATDEALAEFDQATARILSERFREPAPLAGTERG
jgi:hypothetical protein